MTTEGKTVGFHEEYDESDVGGIMRKNESNLSSSLLLDESYEPQSADSGISSQNDLQFRVFAFFVGIFVTLIAIVGLIGNLLIIIVFMRKEVLRKRYWFNINLAILHVLAAFVYGVITLSAFSAAAGRPQPKWSKINCEGEGFLNGFLAISSVYMMVLISIERYIATCHPFKIRRMTFKTKNLWVFGAYVISLAITLPPLLGWSRFIPVGFGWYCCFELQRDVQNSDSYFIYLFTLGFLLPVSTIGWCYLKIWLKIRARSQLLKAFPILTLAKMAYARACRNERRFAVISMTVVFSFLISWSPFAVAALVVHFSSYSSFLANQSDDDGTTSISQSTESLQHQNYAFTTTVTPSSSIAIISPPPVSIMEIVSIFAKLFIVYNAFIYGCLDNRFRRDSERLLRRISLRSHFPEFFAFPSPSSRRLHKNNTATTQRSSFSSSHSEKHDFSQQSTPTVTAILVTTPSSCSEGGSHRRAARQQLPIAGRRRTTAVPTTLRSFSTTATARAASKTSSVYARNSFVELI